MKVADMMIRNPVTAGPDDQLFEVVHRMNDYHVRHLPVTMDGELLGIITDRDIRLHIVALAQGIGKKEAEYLRLDTPVEDVMTRDPIKVDQETDLQEILDIFLEEKVGAIPVVSGNRELIGIIGYIDLLAILRGKV